MKFLIYHNASSISNLKMINAISYKKSFVEDEKFYFQYLISTNSILQTKGKTQYRRVR